MHANIQKLIDRLEANKASMPALSAEADQRIEEQRKRSARLIEDADKAAPDPSARIAVQKQAAIDMLKAMEREFRPVVGDHYPRTIQILGLTAAELFGARDAVDAEVAWFIAHHLDRKVTGASEIERRAKIRREWLERIMARHPGMTISNLESKDFHGPSHHTLSKWLAGKSTTHTKRLRDNLQRLFGCDIADVPI